MSNKHTLVSAEWLYQHLDNPNLIILDASMATNASGKAFETYPCTIPNARRFDLKNVFSDTTSPLPNTVPQPQAFEHECQKLGINQDSQIVVFDTHGIYSSPRAWWLFYVMGHKNIAVLDGGLPSWLQKGFCTASTHAHTCQQGNFTANYQDNLVISFQQVQKNISQNTFLVVDARSEGRFHGTENEPRKHLKSGSIPGSVNIPFQMVLNQGKYKSKDELNALFANRCKGNKALVFSCGSGMTACIIMLACHISYTHSPKIYDGSWVEWASRNDLKNTRKSR